MVEVFGHWYLRFPNAEDIDRVLHVGKQCGFPRMMRSLDYLHWKWKNCPTGWAGQYAGSNNDINVLSKSHLFVNLTNGVALPAKYAIQGKEYTMGYYLADGIYPKWSQIIAKHPPPDVKIARDEDVRLQEFLARHRQIKDKSAYYALRDALIDHLW
ncbi:uncharacterized protein LOC142550048 [Primulina tabacum]|uniref:uncharacterized protein LOC142550048 n=1 Tax=Primulina tabacum TaxID=48773 RepID=UPI003F59D2FB